MRLGKSDPVAEEHFHALLSAFYISLNVTLYWQVLPTLSPSHQYNLRSRNTPSSLHNINFLHNMPSPSTFNEMIRNLRSASRRYTAVIRKPPSDKTDNKSMFSSDEES